MSTPGSPLQLAVVTEFHREGRAIELWTAGMVCIFGWEYLVCLPKEIKHIWRKKFSYYSALYAANRYSGLILGAVAIWVMQISNTGLEADTCRRIYRWQPIGAMVSTILSQAIMAARVHALYFRKLVLAILVAIMAAELVVEVYTLTLVMPTIGPPGIAIPCVAIAPYRWLLAFWAIPLVFDTLTFALTLLKTFMFWRREICLPTMTLIFRDGLIYFAAIFSMNLVNVILFTTQEPGLQAVNLPATTLLNVIMSCRLVLNLRRKRPGIHVTFASSPTSTEEEREADFSTTPVKSQSIAHETMPPSADVNRLTGTDTYV